MDHDIARVKHIKQAIILAGGKGTRLVSKVPDAPKVLAPIGNKTFIDVMFEKLEKSGINKVTLALGYKAEKVKKHLQNYEGNLQIVYSIEDKPLGTGGATKLALMHCDSNATFVLNGDTLCSANFSELELFWLEKCQNNTLILSCKAEDVSQYGAVKISEHIVTNFSEKDLTGPGWINAGIYILPKQALSSFAYKISFSLEYDFLEPLATQQNLYGLQSESTKIIDIGTPDNYDLANKYFSTSGQTL